MIKIDNNFINNAIIKWSPIMMSLGVRNSDLQKSISIFAEVYSYNLISTNQVKIYDHNSDILPISVKIFSKLNLNGIKLIVDYNNDYNLVTQELKIKIDFDANEFRIIGLDPLLEINRLIIDYVSDEINGKIKNNKNDMLIVQYDFINYNISEKIINIKIKYLLYSLKQDRIDKLIKIINSTATRNKYKILINI